MKKYLYFGFFLFMTVSCSKEKQEPPQKQAVNNIITEYEDDTKKRILYSYVSYHSHDVEHFRQQGVIGKVEQLCLPPAIIYSEWKLVIDTCKNN